MSKDLTCNLSIADLLNSAKEAKLGIYSDAPHVTSQQVAKEVKDAEAEFSQVVDKELKRMKVLAGEESDHLLELRRQNEVEMTCPTEAHRLLALSAYQGDIQGMSELEEFYYKQFVNTEGEAKTSIQESKREYLLLSLYWAGRVCNEKERELPAIIYICYRKKFSSQFQIAMRMFWHKRPCFEFDPLTGYSHIPFLTSIFSALRKVCHDEEGKNTLPVDILEMKNTLPIDIWKHICANCGKERDKECALKQCARCKAFSYCSKECQVKHWKAGHKADCKGHHWIESYFPNIRTSQLLNNAPFLKEQTCIHAIRTTLKHE
jgi:hypothetical protein